MKFKNYFLALLLSALFLTGCLSGNDKMVYVFDNNDGVFEFPSTDTLRQSVRFVTSEFDPSKNEPLYFDYIYSEETPNVKKLQSVKISLVDAAGKEIPSDRDLKIEYSKGGGAFVNKEFKNNSAPLNGLVDWKEVNYTYEFAGQQYIKDTATVTFTFADHYKPEQYPDSLKFILHMKWENGERKFETMLHKQKYKGPAFNPKY